MNGLDSLSRDVLSQAATVVTVGAFVSAAVALVATHSLTIASATLLDLLMAAGLLRLSASNDWEPIVAAAAILVLRKLATRGIRAARRSRLRGDKSTPVRCTPRLWRRLNR